MTTIEQLKDKLKKLTSRWYYSKEEIDNSFVDNTSFNSEISIVYSSFNNYQTINMGYGTSYQNKNVVTDNTGNITVEEKPTIPSKISDLNNDSNFIETSNTNGLIKNDGTVDTTSYSTFSGSYNDLSNKPSIPSDLSDLTDTNNVIPSDVSDLTDASNTVFTPKSHNHGRISDDGKLTDSQGNVVSSSKILFASGGAGDGLIIGTEPTTVLFNNSYDYDNIKTGESTTLTMTNQKKINDGINTKFGSVDSALNSKADNNDFDTITATVNYTDNTSETVTFYIVPSNNG